MASYTKGLTIAANTPANTGGAGVSYSVSPDLPTGLSLDAKTGAITGTPTIVRATDWYVVTATNAGGSATVALSITVNDLAPSNLTYANQSAVYTKGVAVAANVPSSAGGAVVSYAVTPSLPDGLSLDASTGAITGTPAAIAAKASFFVSATNSGGSTATVLSITVSDVAPSNLTYTTQSAVYTKGVAVAANVPSSAGGAVVSYAVTPSLPDGLSLDASTGAITGAPAAIAAKASFFVSATNSGGSTATALSITVNDVAPSNLTYATQSAAYTKGVAVTTDVPTSAGGAVVSYAVTPSLPDGLTLDARTGAITGTPTRLLGSAEYVVTAMNSGGSATVALSITVNDLAPSNLTYATQSAVYTKGVAVAANVPSSAGGAVVSYAVTPSLPDGLTLDARTGAITGTPTRLLGSADYVFIATNSGGSTSASLNITVNDVAPSNLTYATQSAVYTKGVVVTANVPNNAGGAVVSYAVTPSLPDGLSLDASTGAITGTPAAIAAKASFSVSAANSGGSTATVLSITVNDVAPRNLTYTTQSAVYTKGVAVAANVPSSAGGGVVSYAVTPSLPDGLTLDARTGAITGAPTRIAGYSTFVVTAANSGGSATAQLGIRVNDAPPGAITYAMSPATYTKGVAIAPNSPRNAGGAVVTYYVNPALPAGLSLNARTGVITGTPTAITGYAGYWVSGVNSGGSSETSVLITVNDAPPTGLSYSATSVVYTKGQPIVANTPHASGGAITSYFMSPSPPPGLSFDPSTGVLKGTPTAVSRTTTYDVTAYNTGGSTATTLVITVNDLPPTGLAYATNPVVYTRGTTIEPNTPTSAGGAVVSYAVSPPLPAGLSMDRSTGAITGKPTAASPPGSYTVTATNSGGSPTATLRITVNDLPPAALIYSTNPAVYTKGYSIVANTPRSSGGVVTSYSVSPALPAGLTLDPSTGAISGTPTALSGTASYLVTATNVSGSTSVLLRIAVNDIPPSKLAYSRSSVIYQVGKPIIPNVPRISGGAVVSYAPDWIIPSGLRLDPTTGVISGTPAFLAQSYAYSVRASNTGGSTTATVNITMSDVGEAIQVSAGSVHTCAVVGGSAQCWGLGAAGQLGNQTESNSSVGTQVLGLESGVTAIASGASHTCAIVRGGAMCWGYGPYGELGSGEAKSSPSPVSVSGLTSGVTAIAAGELHMCAIMNGGVWCWGSNALGELGDGTTASRLVPVAALGLTTGVTAIAAGGMHTCAIARGAVVCWGKNASGQLGDGSTVSSLVPVAVTGLAESPSAISAGWNHTCAVVSGAVRCWGGNSKGQLGDGTTNDRLVPVAVLGLTTGVTALAAADYRTCALAGGGVHCWGDNTYGQLGNGSTEASATPVPVSGLASGVSAISAGGGHTCAPGNGGIVCWGRNDLGQLGNATTTDSLLPTSAFLK